MDENECKNPLKVDAMIWEVRDGVPTKLKALNIIFVPEKGNVLTTETQNQISPDEELEEKVSQVTELINEPINEPVDEPEQNSEISSQVEVKDRGEYMTRIWSNNVFKNVLAEVKEGMSKHEENDQLKARIAPYYPNSKPSSLGVYLHVHKKFIEEKPDPVNAEINDIKGARITGIMGVPIHTNILEKLKLYGDEQKMMEIVSSYYPNIKEKSIRKYLYSYIKYISGDISPEHYTDKAQQQTQPKKRQKSRKPKGALGRDNTYNTWVMPEERDSVKRAISKWGFKATTESIGDVTGIKSGRVRAILHWMLKKHEIYMSREDLTPVYHIVDVEQKQ